jgi:hypothetical protein
MADSEEWRFRAAIVKSWRAVFAVAKHLHSTGGFTIRIGPLRIRPDDGKVIDYGDDHDLAVQTTGSIKLWPVEVKWREFDFTCCADFPYPTIFIDRKTKADKAEPFAYFVVNKAMTHAAIVKTSTKASWIAKQVSDTTKIGHRPDAYTYTIYECPKELAEFVVLRQDGDPQPK